MKKEAKKVKVATIENEKLCAVLSYLFIGLIWYLIDEKIQKSKFAKYHVKQGLVLLITNIILCIIAGIPFFGWIIAPLIYIIILVLMVLGIISALADKEKELPIIGKYAEKFKF